MFSVLLVTALAAAQPAPRTDTTFAVAPGGRLGIEAFQGAATVRGWDREAIRVRAAHGAGTRVVIRRRGNAVSIEAESHRPGPPGRVEYHIDVPRSFSLDAEGMNLAVDVHDLDGAVTVNNVAGNVVVRGTRGPLELESVGGSISVLGARGNVRVSTTNQGIQLVDVSGDVLADAVNGSIDMRAVDAARIRASTVNGAVSYAGVIREGGRYYFGTHNGLVTVAVPEHASANVNVAARTGQVHTTFPVTIRPGGDGTARFSLGGGSASIEIESFNGTVRLVRPQSR